MGDSCTTFLRALVVVTAGLALCVPAVEIQSIGSAGASPLPMQSNRLESVMSTPSLVDHSTLIGRVDPNTTIDGAIGLEPRDEQALEQFIGAVTTKGSANFHRYLRPGQFAARFGPSESTIAAVISALGKAGLQVSGVSSNRLLVNFHGTVGQIEDAFHTELADYRLPNGTIRRATTSPVDLPANIAPDVNVVTGLDTLVTFHSLGLMHRTAAGHYPPASASAVPIVPGAPKACAAATLAASSLGGLTDDQIANAYGAFGLYKQGDTGRGESVAIFELEPFARSDISTFDSCYFGKEAATAMAGRLRVISVDGGQPAGFGSGEALLDVEDVSALSPGANINVYEGPNTTFGVIDVYNQIVAADADQVVSTSWGLCETALQQGEPGEQQEEDAIFQQAAAQGQTIVAAAGDDGSDDCASYDALPPLRPTLTVDDPSSQPYVVSAGGTTIEDATQPPVEHVWNDGAGNGAGGGGISNTWVMPSWQDGSLVPGIAKPSTVHAAEQVDANTFCAGSSYGSTFGGLAGEPCREVPDVSAQADQFTGAITIYSASFGPLEAWTTVGGTSSAAPIWAAMLTLANASPSCSNDKVEFTGGTSVPDAGFASPLLYAIASNPVSYGESFNDIKEGNNDVYNLDHGRVFSATAGYDMASGLGSPQLTTAKGGDGLAYYLCTYGTSETVPSVTGLEPDELSTSSGGSVTVEGTNFETAGSPDVREVWINNFLMPPTDVVVSSDTQLTLNDIPSGTELVPTDPSSDGAGRAVVTVTLHDGTTSRVTPASVLDIVDTTAGGSPTVVPAVTEVSSYGGPQVGGNHVTIFGSGFGAGVDAVTFGGVAATSYDVVSSYEVLATVPALSGTQTTCETALSASDDICQTEVVVTNANGSSKSYPISPAYEGLISYNASGALVPSPGCGCELTPAPSEYDYFPPPRITSVSTSAGPFDYADEGGTSMVTITGQGLNNLSLNAVLFGPSGRYSSIDPSITFASGTELQVIAPPIARTVNPRNVPVTVTTLAGTSNSPITTYAGVPIVTSVSPDAAPDTGSTAVEVVGNGFSDARIINLDGTGSSLSYASAHGFHLSSNLRATFFNPPQPSAIVHVEVCTATACSMAATANRMTIYARGNPVVTGTSPRSGPAHGGMLVTIHGRNLGCATRVYFGSRRAASFRNASAPYLDCGSSSLVVARAPPGQPGTTAAITLQTAESAATRSGRSKVVATAKFTYIESAPSAPLVTRTTVGFDSLTVAWRPPLTNGGSPVTAYVLRAYARGFPEFTAVLTPRDRSFEFTGLYWGTRWTISVTAESPLGLGVPAVRTARPRRPDRTRTPELGCASGRCASGWEP
jgi:hypothetical protein